MKEREVILEDKIRGKIEFMLKFIREGMPAPFVLKYFKEIQDLVVELLLLREERHRQRELKTLADKIMGGERK